MILGLATLSVMLLPLAMLAAWPEARAGLWPGGRIAALAGLVLGFAAMLALMRAPHAGFSLMALQFWAGAMVAGRAMQLAIRAHGPAPARAALLAVLVAGPLYVTLLPLMELVYGASREIDWTRDMPGFNHIRKMGHLLTASAAAGLGLAAIRPAGRGRRADVALAVLGTLALALVLWTGARGAWLALLAGTVLALAGAWAAGLAPRPLRLVAMTAAAIGLALLLPSPTVHLGLAQEIASTAARTGDLNALSSNRIDLWAMVLELIGQAPLSGYGWGQLLLIQDRHPFPQVHNLPLDLMLGLGVPMGLLALGLMLALWVAAHRRAPRLGPEGIAALVLLDTMAVYSLVSGTYYYGVPVVLTGLAWGICLASPASASGPRG